MRSGGRRPLRKNLGLDRAGVALRGPPLSAWTADAQDGAPPSTPPGLHRAVRCRLPHRDPAGRSQATTPVARAGKRRIDYRLQACAGVHRSPGGTVGLTRRRVGRASTTCRPRTLFLDHGKSLVLGETPTGSRKLSCATRSPTRILGGHIVGPEASDGCSIELIAVMYIPRPPSSDLARIPLPSTLAEILTYPAEDLAERARRQTGRARGMRLAGAPGPGCPSVVHGHQQGHEAINQ